MVWFFIWPSLHRVSRRRAPGRRGGPVGGGTRAFRRSRNFPRGSGWRAVLRGGGAPPQFRRSMRTRPRGLGRSYSLFQVLENRPAGVEFIHPAEALGLEPGAV